MFDPFEIIVDYNGQELKFDAQLLQAGYTVRFNVQIKETEWIFERDEEGKFRAILPEGQQKDNTDTGLLRVIAEKIEALLA